MKTLLSRLIVIVITVLCLVQAAYAGRLIVVFGIDETGSYSFRNLGISIGKEIISDLHPGDVLYVRRITEKSYADSSAIFRCELPDIGTKPKNIFDRRAIYRWRQKVKAIKTLKVRAIKLLSELPSLKAKKTDIWGFLAAAAERFQIEGKSCRRLVVIASDMQDNCGRKIHLNLLGAKIIVAGFESGKDPARAHRVRAYWTRTLKECKAGTVTFLPPDSVRVAINREFKERLR